MLNNKVCIIEKFIIITAFIIGTGGIIPVLLANTNYIDISFKFIFFSLYFLSSFFLLKRVKGISSAIFNYKLLILLLLIIGLSFIWSYYPSVTLNKYIALLGTTIIGIYISIRLNTKQIVQYLTYSFFIISILSLILIVFFPALGVHKFDVHAGIWKGIYTHKNSLGRYMTYGLVITIIYSISYAKSKSFSILSILLATILLFGSNSTTSILLVFILLFLVLIVRLFKINLFLLISLLSFGFITLCIILGIVIMNAKTLVGFFNKDLSFSGRTDIWYYSWQKFIESPLLGYGFGAFWHEESSLAYYIRKQVGWMDAPHSHNLILDLLLQVGIIGTLVFLIIFIKCTLNSIRLLRLSSEPSNYFYLITLASIFLFGLTESTILVPNNIFWILFIIIIIRLPIDLKNYMIKIK